LHYCQEGIRERIRNIFFGNGRELIEIGHPELKMCKCGCSGPGKWKTSSNLEVLDVMAWCDLKYWFVVVDKPCEITVNKASKK
jgi:hypothetical protein